MGERITNINYEYLRNKFKEANTTMKEVSVLMGHGEQYLSINKSKGSGLTEEDVAKLVDLVGADENVLLCRKGKEVASTDDAIANLIMEFGKLSERVATLEKRIEEPVTVSIPMNAKDMAVLVMGELLESGWCTKDDVLVAFNQHHIPIEHLTYALKAHNALAATSGHAERTRTFYIKEADLLK